MTGLFTIEDMRTELAELEDQLAERRGPTTLEQVARTRRWLDAGEHEALFAEAAARLEQAWKDNQTGSTGSWARAGGLWQLAGDRERARRALQQAVAGGTDWEPIPQGAAGVMYLLGEHGRAAAHAPDHPEGMLAAAAREADPDRAADARNRWLAWEKLAERGPHQDRGPRPLTGWDWIEETFRLESELRGEPVPSHLEMLRRTGMLRELSDPDEIRPCRPAPRPGVPVALGAGAQRPSHPVLDEEPDDEGEWILGMSRPDFQDAALWAAEWLHLHDQPALSEATRRLIEAYDGRG